MQNLTDIPIACTIEAIPESEREQHMRVWAQLVAAKQGVRETENGYEIIFPVTSLLSVAEMMSRERLCCPFLNFQVEVAPAARVVILRMNGNEEVKAFIKHAIIENLPG